MEDELKELQQLALTDPDAHYKYLALLVRSGKAREIEIQARVGNQDAILAYLQILDYERIIEIEHLWVTPFFVEAHNFQDTYELWPYTEPFMPSIRYSLGMTLDDIEKYYETLYEFKAGTLRGAFVNDVFDLELSELTSERLRRELLYNLQHVPRHGDISNQPQAELISQYSASLTKYYNLNGSAILRMDRNGVHIQAPHEITALSQDERTTVHHFNQTHKQSLLDAIRTKSNERPSPAEWSPKRQTKLITTILPTSSVSTPYVMIVHIPTVRAFTLGRGYNLLDREVASQDEILSAMRYNTQIDPEYLPTSLNHIPEWAQGLPKEEFVAYWVGV